MPQTDTIPVSASTASTGLGIRYLGKWVYGYSGVLPGSTSADTDYLSFTSGSGIIVAQVDMGSTNETTRKTVYISLNDIRIVHQDVDNAYSYPNKWPVIIPPFTKCLMSLRLGGDDGMSSWFTLTGRVYGAE